MIFQNAQHDRKLDDTLCMGVNSVKENLNAAYQNILDDDVFPTFAEAVWEKPLFFNNSAAHKARSTTDKIFLRNCFAQDLDLKLIQFLLDELER